MSSHARETYAILTLLCFFVNFDILYIYIYIIYKTTLYIYYFWQECRNYIIISRPWTVHRARIRCTAKKSKASPLDQSSPLIFAVSRRVRRDTHVYCFFSHQSVSVDNLAIAYIQMYIQLMDIHWIFYDISVFFFITGYYIIYSWISSLWKSY